MQISICCTLKIARRGPLAALALIACASLATAGEGPYFVTYSHRMEEPGNLELATRGITLKPAGANRMVSAVAEFEYGVKAWWTTEFYLDGQTTARNGTLFTGYRWENRFRLLPREHWINPVFYFEIENINGADKNLLAVVGHDGEENLAEPNHETREVKKRELEAKLILSSNVKGWNISENFIAEKDVRHSPFEFGYAAAVSRPLAFAARSERCQLCPENFSAGVEVYGGLGTHENFGFEGTSHYVAPTVAWTVANGSTTFKVSPGFGVTQNSIPFLLRFGVSYEISQIGRSLRQWMR